MNKKFLVIALLAISVMAVSSLGAATWGYNFGTGTGSYTTSNSSSTTFLPAQPAGGGTNRVRVGNGGGGGFYLENPGLSDFGSGTELRIAAPTGTGSGNINKYSVIDFTAGGSLARKDYFRTQVRFGNSTGGNADSGTFYFFHGDHASFSDDNVVATDAAILGMRWVLGSGGTITTSWMVDNVWQAFTGMTFVQGVTYVMEFWINNGSGAAQPQYTYNGTQYQVISPGIDMWVNGVLVGDELGNAWTLGRNVASDSFMFYGEGSTGNVANLFLDTMEYTNDWDSAYNPTYTDYYSKTTGSLHLTTTWGIVPDGSGKQPTNFTTAGNTFHIRNNATPTITANWTVSGTGTL